MKVEEAELVSVTAVTPSYGQDKAVIDSMIATAKAYPRDIERAVKNSILIATLDSEIAASCTYSVPRGGKPITGPSVHLARIIMQNWGNLRVESKVTEITHNQIVCQAVAFDIETNIAVKVEVRKSIISKNGRLNDDMITVTGNAGNAVALRNAVFNVVPKGVTDKVYKAAVGLLTGDISDETKLIHKRKNVISKLQKEYGVTLDEILKAVGKTKEEHIGSEELVVLIGIGTAIKEGDTTVDEAFRPELVKKAKVDETKEKLRAGQQATIQMP
jgi:hypothetical protein